MDLLSQTILIKRIVRTSQKIIQNKHSSIKVNESSFPETKTISRSLARDNTKFNITYYILRYSKKKSTSMITKGPAVELQQVAMCTCTYALMIDEVLSRPNAGQRDFPAPKIN